MISLDDCIAMAGLTQREIDAIAEEEQIERISPAALTDYLLSLRGGSPRNRGRLRDDIRSALARGDEHRAHQLLMALCRNVRESSASPLPRRRKMPRIR